MRPFRPLPLGLFPSTLLVLAGLVLTACNEGHGVRMGADGSFKSVTAELERDDASAHLVKSLQDGFGPGWTVEATLDPLPVWEALNEEEYGWKQLTATIVCRGTGTPPTGMDGDAITVAVRDFLRRRVARPWNENLTVTVRFAEPLAPGSVSVSASAVAATAAASAAPGVRTYTVQPGDTLADISSLFYGAPEHWRRITEANPGIDPGKLTPGTVLAVPR